MNTAEDSHTTYDIHYWPFICDEVMTSCYLVEKSLIYVWFVFINCCHRFSALMILGGLVFSCMPDCLRIFLVTV
jgi:hypothetical protein